MAQVFATQATLDSVATLIPTIIAGVLVDLLDVRLVLTLTGGVTAASALLMIFGPRDAGVEDRLPTPTERYGPEALVQS